VSETSAAVRFENITKRFPGVQALDDVSLEIARGSCHALCGENGAGKSTLGKILAGIYEPDGGRLLVDGREVAFTGPRDALAAGVGMVHQELAFCGNLSIAENLCLASLPSERGFVERSELSKRANAMLAEIGAELDVSRPLGELTTAQQQIVQIASAVGSGARIVVFDEPTSSLSQVDAERLYELIDRLKQRGVTCIYVSHRMPEVFRLCDAVTVLRDGRHVATRPSSELSEAELVQMMIGRAISEYFPRPRRAAQSDELLRVDALSLPGKFEDVSFTLHAGEVVGLAGLVGAGRSDVAAALFGIEPATSGSIRVGGRAASVRTPREAIELGIGLVPEDRKRQGLVQSESGLRNTSLTILDRLSRFSWIDRARERGIAQRYFDRMRVRAPSVDTVVAGLSGGNQQKIVLARWLAAQSEDSHSRRADARRRRRGEGRDSCADRRACGTGRGNPADLERAPELLNLSDRILVLRAGRMVGEVARADASQERLLRLMAGLA
jgi:ABC-type sugar transport system ATPase subunit